MNHNQEKNKSIKIDPELTQMLELTEKDIKTVTISIFHWFKSGGMEDKKDPN